MSRLLKKVVRSAVDKSWVVQHVGQPIIVLIGGYMNRYDSDWDYYESLQPKEDNDNVELWELDDDED